MNHPGFKVATGRSVRLREDRWCDAASPEDPASQIVLRDLQPNRRRGWSSPVLAAFLSLTLGCASVEHRPLNPSDDESAQGIRYYDASPYVLVYANAGGGLTSEIVYLADPFRLMSAQPKQFLSTLDVTLSFENGVLTQSKAVGDGSIVPAAILQAAKTAATAILAEPSSSAEQLPPVHIFKIIQAHNGEFLLVGGPASTAYSLRGNS